ncbi:MAG: OmpA family protein [Ignavibacteriaceae bacterium]
MKLLISFMLLTVITFAQPDIDGSKDHPIVSRYPGSHIVYYDEQDYKEYSIATGAVTGYRTISDWLNVEGKLTRIYYEIEGDVTITQIYKNYLNAFEKAGFEILAKGLNPTSNNSKEVGGTSWMGTFYVKNPYPTNGNILLGAGSSSSGGSGYIAGKIKKNGGTAYAIFGGKEYSKDKKIYMLDIIEETKMDNDLITINADEMLKGIKAEGKIALYGIYFDTDKWDVKPESEPTLKEIVSLLKNDPLLNIYVVGHTDMQGKFDHNIELSKKRADSVVKELTEKYGINKNRLTPDGVGPLVPIASNVTEEGRKKNRRVELVAK